jgi:Na+/H+ antiporter NhaD/arsenite permease-like protein
MYAAASPAMIAATAVQPSALALVPFGLLLAAIALCPLLTPKLWERYYRHLAVGLGLIIVIYYSFGLGAGRRIAKTETDFLSFIVFIGALFVVAGGIHLRVRGEATPFRNVAFLGIGAVLSNLLGTTGASMLLIRPWVRMNKYRYTSFHTAFFIFLVSNIGGCLTPMGDPPLFLGYLMGVPFFWTARRLLPAWLLAVGLVLLIFYVVDRHNFFRAPEVVREAETEKERFNASGTHNFALLAGILAAVALLPLGFREIVIVLLAAISYNTTPPPIHEANHFSFVPIREVAWLFLGIFTTMAPAIDFLESHAVGLGLSEPGHFYWVSGGLSSVLDNAPTYATLMAAAFGTKGLILNDPSHVRAFLDQHGIYTVAVSLGSVFFGAMTYIGNGPNLMVKAVADHAKVHTPGFFAYIARFSLPVLLPVFVIVRLVFLPR